MNTLKKIILGTAFLLAPLAQAQEAQGIEDCFSLYHCSERGSVAGVRDALDQGEDPNFLGPNSGKTPLIRAVEKGHLPVVQLLLEAGADPNARTPSEMRNYQFSRHDNFIEFEVDIGSWPVLILAVHHGDENIVNALLAAGADLNLTNGEGTTALAKALDQGRRDLARLLLDAGATRQNLGPINFMRSWGVRVLP